MGSTCHKLFNNFGTCRGFGVVFYGEISLLIRHDYTIAQIIRFSRGNKFDKQIVYIYRVNGQLYERHAAWDGQAILGHRYVVKYATYAPYGNDFLYKQPVPDSIKQDSGQTWQKFLRVRQLFYRIPSHARQR
jgi:hypothetical protein